MASPLSTLLMPSAEIISDWLTFGVTRTILRLSRFNRFVAAKVTGRLINEEVFAGNYAIRVIPETIPRMEQKKLCAAFLEAAIRFYDSSENQAAFERWRAEKGGCLNGSEDRK